MSACLFLIGVMLSNAAAPSFALAQDRELDKPTPQQAAPARKIVRDPPEALRVEDMTMEELQQRLAEYEAGKRDHRDGYIILNQLWFNYQANRQTNSSEFQAIANKRQELLGRHPELGSLKDFRLSDAIRYESTKERERNTALEKAKRWTPSDSKLLRIIGSDRQAVAVYQYRLEFYRLPPDVKLEVPKGRDRQRFHRNDAEIQPGSLSARKVIRFRTRFDIKPNWPDTVKARFLACSNPVAFYSPANEQERQAMALLGFTHGMKWVNKAGTEQHFCGVLGLDGTVLYKFPFTPSYPKSLMKVLAIAEDESWAAVMIGEVVEGEDRRGIGKPREVWVWRSSGQLEKYPADHPSAFIRDLLGSFR